MRLRPSPTVVVVLALALALTLTACGDDGSDADLADFIAIAEDEDCAADLNRLYRIDGERVLWHHRDQGCADAGYGIILYGSTPDDELCSQFDTIGGPLAECRDESAREQFETIVRNLDDPDLGLGDDHDVEVVWDENDAGS